jgi:hypothetical protein
VDTSKTVSFIASGTRFYVAARFERQAEARELADELVLSGFRVTSRWLHAPGISLDDPAAARLWAERDLEDLFRADVYLLLSDDIPGRGGKDFEGGVAYAFRRRIIVVGPPAHVFHYLSNVERLPSVEAFLAATRRDANA